MRPPVEPGVGSPIERCVVRGVQQRASRSRLKLLRRLGRLQLGLVQLDAAMVLQEEAQPRRNLRERELFQPAIGHHGAEDERVRSRISSHRRAR